MSDGNLQNRHHKKGIGLFEALEHQERNANGEH
jgi:hypothetical protein